MSKPIRVVGIPWYHPQDYTAILRIMTDSDQLPGTFDIWLSKAERGEKMLTADGYIVMRVFIDPETFPDWCSSRGLDINAKARMEFANLVAKKTYGSTH